MRLITPMPNTVETGRVPPPASRESTADKTLGVYLAIKPSHRTACEPTRSVDRKRMLSPSGEAGPSEGADG